MSDISEITDANETHESLDETEGMDSDFGAELDRNVKNIQVKCVRLRIFRGKKKNFCKCEKN